MQTFLPYPSFADSARCLDFKRLGKQRVEVKQILKALEPNSTSRWKHHPAVLMWKGYETCLADYGLAMCQEWLLRGYKDSLGMFFWHLVHDYPSYKLPPWLGYEPFHASHRSNLLRKLPSHYSQFGWTEPSTLDYVWPTKLKEEVFK